MSLKYMQRRVEQQLSADSRWRWARRAAPTLVPALALLFFWKLAFSGQILARGDTFLYFYPYWQAAAEALADGRVPLWNTHIFMGAPFIANSQAGFFYPLNWPLWLALPTPYAASASIVLHVMLAALGTYLLARRQLGLSVAGATMAAGAFALGGYLTAQVEHVNQLQGLAWLPWLLAVAGGRPKGGTTGDIGRLLCAGLIVALQMLSGHTQTLFISIVALVIFRLVALRGAPSGDGTRWRLPALSVALPLAALLVGGLLAAVQLLPTWQLTQLSGRQGGLPFNEAVSFSWNPLLMTQSLLPPYGGELFTEYVAFLPVTLLLLAVVAGWHWRRVGPALPPLALAASGLFLALGRFNPVYLLLAQLPGFSYFRAPARWLVLYALGIALLAGLGLDIVRGVYGVNGGRRPGAALRWAAGLLLGLMALGFASVPLAEFLPVGLEAVVGRPTWGQLAAWLVELALALWLAGRLLRAPERRRQALTLAMGVLALVVLFLASRNLPYNRLTTFAAFGDLRPPIARLQAMQRCDLLPEVCQPAPGRFLSLSDIFFDPGDLAELESIYGDRLTENAFYDYIIAVKQKEIIAPNLPMVYGLASVDGFDGGLLPLRDYGTLMSLILEGDVATSDGRLREYLDAAPEARWLDLFDARTLITDKVGDEWRQGVFFDTQHAQALAPGESVSVGYAPDYVASELWVLGEATGGTVTVTGADGGSQTLQTEVLGAGLWRAEFPEPGLVEGIVLSAGDEPWLVRGLALVDGRDDTFQPIVAGNYRLIYSGDVKIYENLDVLPRAFVVNSWRWQPDVAGSVAAMSAPEFDPRLEAVVVGAGEDVAGEENGAGQATIVSYAAEEVVIETESAEPALLVLVEAIYPGWQITVDGEPAEIRQVDGLFRGVFLAAGEHEVRFEFTSQPYELGRWITFATVILWIGALGVLLARYRRQGRHDLSSSGV